MKAAPYTRTIDLMDESVFPIKSHYAQKENPKKSVTREQPFVSQSNEEIIKFVVNEMKDTLG